MSCACLGPNTIFEVRGVAAVLRWIIDNLGETLASETVTSYMEALYPSADTSAEAADYQLLLRLVARMMGAESFAEALCIRRLATVRNAICVIDTAAWYALHTGVRPNAHLFERDSAVLRFAFAVQELAARYVDGETRDPRLLLDDLDTSDRARGLDFLPLDDAISGAAALIEKIRARLNDLWHPDAAAHFEHTTQDALRGLQLRRRRRWLDPLGLDPLAIDAEAAWLGDVYEAPQAAHDWYSFRNASFHWVAAPSTVRTKLEELFGLAELVAGCESCEVLHNVEVPRWRRRHRFVCGNCGHTTEIGPGDVTMIHVPDDEDEEAPHLA
jgi:hypothetical protein